MLHLEACRTANLHVDSTETFTIVFLYSYIACKVINSDERFSGNAILGVHSNLNHYERERPRISEDDEGTRKSDGLSALRSPHDFHKTAMVADY